MPDHWMTKIVEEFGVPIITTSANCTGNEYMTCIEDLDSNIKSKVDFIIYEGIKEGKPSKILDLTDKVKVTIRK